jgi:hypothetical protein
VGGQRHAPAALPPGKTRYPLYKRLDEPQGRSGRGRIIMPPPPQIQSPDMPNSVHIEVETVWCLSTWRPTKVSETTYVLFDPHTLTTLQLAAQPTDPTWIPVRIYLLNPTGHVMHQQVEHFNNCTLCPHCIYVFCVYLRTNSDLCHLQHKLIGFCNWDEKCLQRGTDWGFKWSGLRSVF